MAGDKTEKASPKKKKDERKKGNVFQSRDVVTAGTIVVSFYIMKFWMPHIYSIARNSIYKYIGLMESTTDINYSFAALTFKDIALSVFGAAGILMVSVMFFSIVLTGSQTRFLFTSENLKFKFSKLNPLTGIRRMFSVRSLMELLKSLIKILILGFVIYSSISDNLYRIPKLMAIDIKSSLFFMFDTIMSLIKSVIISFAALSALDYLYQWWEYERNIRMSKQEIKEEYKQTEGDPQLKGRMKEKARAISMTRMMQQVPKADVIIRNPTHFAVAIKYDINKDRAPIVLAKGMDSIAIKIIEMAAEHKIEMVENRPLARALYENAELNREIPEEFYEPIAEILAWVYRIKDKGI
jgi:flagellar biosynthetic protein FlhB